jgi:metallo-beta-lactamase class B
VKEAGRERELLFVNLPTVVMPLVGNKKYPGIVEDFERTFASQKKLRPEIWLAGHASQHGMAAKSKAGSYVDPAGYVKAVAEHEQRFRAQLAKERK